MARVQEQSEATPTTSLPYEKAVQTLGYAGHTLKDIRKLLRKLGLVAPPMGDRRFRRIQWQIKRYANSALEIIGPDVDLIANFGLDPLYTWARTCKSEGRPPEAWRTTRLLEALANPAVRQIMDLSLILRFEPQLIADMLNRRLPASGPLDDEGRCLQWDATHVQFWSGFFWDPWRMTQSDWAAYSLMSPTQPVADYARRLGSLGPAGIYIMIRLAFCETLRDRTHLAMKLSHEMFNTVAGVWRHHDTAFGMFLRCAKVFDNFVFRISGDPDDTEIEDNYEGIIRSMGWDRSPDEVQEFMSEFLPWTNAQEESTEQPSPVGAGESVAVEASTK